jgi:hypothetical protein
MPLLALFLQDVTTSSEITRPSTALDQNPRSLAIALILIAILIMIALVVTILPSWYICKKAGFSPWLSFLHILPFGTLIYLYVVAFSVWKVVPVPVASVPVPSLPPVPPQA